LGVGKSFWSAQNPAPAMPTGSSLDDLWGDPNLICSNLREKIGWLNKTGSSSSNSTGGYKVNV